MSRLFKLGAACVVGMPAAVAAVGCDSPGTSSREIDGAIGRADDSAPVLSFVDLSETGRTSLERSADGVSFELETSGLLSGNAYTIWFAVFNETGECAFGTPDVSLCGHGDLANAAARPDMLFGTGKVVGAAGRTTFEGTVRVGDPSGSINAPVGLPSHGLEDPQGAEIHLIVHDHGAMVPAYMPDMIKSIDGGCTDAGVPSPGVESPWNDNAVFGRRGPNTCVSVQYSLHPPAP